MKSRKTRRMEVFTMILFLGLGISLPVILTYEKERVINIESDDDFRKYKFEGDGTHLSPYIIEYLNLVDEEKIAISISNTNSYFIIRHNYLENNLLCGIRLIAIRTGTAQIYNNTIIGHSLAGILLRECNLIDVSNNTLIENTNGIWLDSTDSSSVYNNVIYAYRPPLDRYDIRYRGIQLDDSEKNDIYWNYILNMAFGIYLEHSDRNDIFSTLIESATQIGLGLAYSNLNELALVTVSENYGNSFSFLSSNNNSVSNCTFSESKNGFYFSVSNFNSVIYSVFHLNEVGLYMVADSLYNTFRYNQFSNNSEEAFKLYSGMYNVIHHNSFSNNSLDIETQVSDNGENNTWYSEFSLEGNYWFGWNSSLTYNITGTANSIDLYPLSDPIVLAYSFSSVLAQMKSAGNTFISEKILLISDLKNE